MGACSGRCFLITICALQLLCTTERLVFDFLGFLWSCILGDFLQIVFVFFGLIGTVQYRAKIIIVYTVWSLLWIAWNIFLICLYLNVSTLSRVQDKRILSLGVESSASWWIENGIGCTYNTTYNDLGEEIRPNEGDVSGCLIEYYYVECIHAAIHCFLALVGFCVSFYVIYVLTEVDDSSLDVRGELEYIKMRHQSPLQNILQEEPRTNLGFNSLSFPVGTGQSTHGNMGNNRRIIRPPPSPIPASYPSYDSRQHLVFPTVPGHTAI